MNSHFTFYRILNILILSILIAGSTYAQSITYYVSSSTGNDKNDGLSVAKPWATLTKVNNTTFKPGDKILLKSGDTWTGQLVLHGSGSDTNAIIVDMYDGTIKPRIDGNGVTSGGTIYIANQDCIEINNLELTNDIDDGGAERRGVCVEASNYGVMHHIYLKNLYIHNVNGLVSTDDGNMAAKRSAAIGIQTLLDDVATRFDDIWIDGCVIDSINEIGIYTYNFSGSIYPKTAEWNQRRITNLRITNNTLSNLAKNGMILRYLDGGLIEHNVLTKTSIQATGNTIFTASCDGPVFQYNEGSYNYAGGTGTRDGSLYDADLRSCNITFQYSYSHNNRHGLFWNCTQQADSNIICRYNISQNDQGIIFCLNYPVTSMYIYNNTVFIDSALSPVIISERNNGGTGSRTYHFYNNIIYNKSTSSTYNVGVAGYTRIFNSNVFYGKHPSNEPADTNKITSDPLLVGPGSGKDGIASLGGYKLQAKSPCINSGVALFNQPGFDFWNNPIPNGSAIDRGACEFENLTGALEQVGVDRRQFELAQNYPNPFNPATRISYSLTENAHVALKIFNMQGSCVRVLKEADESAGNHSMYWNGMDESGKQVASGVYFARLESSSKTSVIKMLLVR